MILAYKCPICPYNFIGQYLSNGKLLYIYRYTDLDKPMEFKSHTNKSIWISCRDSYDILDLKLKNNGNGHYLKELPNANQFYE